MYSDKHIFTQVHNYRLRHEQKIFIDADYDHGTAQRVLWHGKQTAAQGIAPASQPGADAAAKATERNRGPIQNQRRGDVTVIVSSVALGGVVGHLRNRSRNDRCESKAIFAIKNNELVY